MQHVFRLFSQVDDPFKDPSQFALLLAFYSYMRILFAVDR